MILKGFVAINHCILVRWMIASVNNYKPAGIRKIPKKNLTHNISKQNDEDSLPEARPIDK